MRKLRIIILSAILSTLVIAGIPINNSLAHWIGKPHVHKRKKRRRHSLAWWRRHRALMEQRRALAMQRSNGVDGSNANAANALSAASVTSPFNLQKPETWNTTTPSIPGEMKFIVRTADGQQTGTAAIGPVAGVSASTTAPQRKTLAGVPLKALGRTVIDRMVAEGGWVVNDSVREIEGRRVYSVMAQTGKPGAPAQAWNFYFTEVDGRIYSLSTIAPVEFAEPLAADSAQVLASLRLNNDGAVASN